MINANHLSESLRASLNRKLIADKKFTTAYRRGSQIHAEPDGSWLQVSAMPEAAWALRQLDLQKTDLIIRRGV